MSELRQATLSSIISDLKARQKNKMISLVLIDGKMGSGKTQLSSILSEGVDVNFTLRRNILLEVNPLKLIDRIDAMEPDCAPVIDDAILSQYKQRWMEKGQQAFYKYFCVDARKTKHAVVIQNIQTLYDMRNSYLQGGHVAYWIHCFRAPTPEGDLGDAVVMRPCDLPGPDPFFRKELMWKGIEYEKMRAIGRGVNSVEHQRAIYSMHRKCFVGFIKFPMMPRYQEYLDMYQEIRPEIMASIKNEATMPEKKNKKEDEEDDVGDILDVKGGFE